MSADNIKMSDEVNNVEMGQQQETSFYNANDTDAFLPSKIKEKDPDSSSAANKFHGLTREELEQFSKDPKWVKIRWVLFIILIVGWAAMLIAAIIIVVVEPKCPPTPSLEWFQDGVAYDVDIEKFKDSNGDSIGDVAGVEEQLEHFKELSVESVWLSNVLSVDDEGMATINEDFDSLAAAFKQKDIRVVIQMAMLKDEYMDNVIRKCTDAGAGGFVIAQAGTSDEQYAETTTRIQQDILDLEYNKFDDRARVVIGAVDVTGNASVNLSAVVYHTTVDCDNLTSWDCTVKTLKTYGEANKDATENAFKKGSAPRDPWKIPQTGVELYCAVCELALKMTLPGTPNVMGGNEIGLPAGDYMKWDDSSNAGFTSNDSWVYPDSNDAWSVLAQRSVGFKGYSVYPLFKNLAALRADEPSLKWGDFQWIDLGEDAIVFVRNATAVAPVVVAINTKRSRAGSLVFGDYSLGEVLVASREVDLTVGDTIELDAVYLPMNSVLVARMSQPEKDN